jgi:RHS repeat-associated protein
MRMRWLVRLPLALAVVLILVLALVPGARGKVTRLTTLFTSPPPTAATAPTTASAGSSGAGFPAPPGQAAPVPPDANPAICSTAPLVNCATGEFSPQFTDISVPGRGVPLTFILTYSSTHAGSGGSLGFGWTDNYDMTLSQAGTGVVSISAGNEPGFVFIPEGGGRYRAPQQSFASLVPGPGTGYTLTLLRTRTRYVFPAAGSLLQESDFNGDVTKLAYVRGQLMSVTGPAGKLTFAYTGGRLAGVTDPMGRTTSFGYDPAGDLATVTRAGDLTWSFSYGSGHLLRTLTDPDGGITTCAYGTSGMISSLTDPAGGTTTWSYTGDPATAAGATTTVTGADGYTAEYVYTIGKLMLATLGGGTGSAEASTSYTYDPVTGGVAKAWDPDGNLTTYTYDASGNVLTSTDPMGHRTVYTYNDLDEVTSQTVAPGETTRYGYDTDGNLLAVTDALDEITTYRYDGRPGDITSVSGASGQVTRYTYSPAGDITAVTVVPRPGQADTIAYTYDKDGELVCEASADATADGVSCPAVGARRVASTTTISYSRAGEVISETDPDGHTTTYAYDADGDQISVTDAAGGVTHYAYDPDGRQIAVTNPDGGIALTTYDPSGQVLTQTSASGQVTSYTYDALGRVITQTSPLGQTTRYGYDPDGNRTSLTDPAGAVTTYVYNTDGELTAIRYSGTTTPAVTYTYYPDGARETMTDGTGTTSYSYDRADRLTGVTDGGAATVSYRYSASGQLISLTYPDGQTVTRTYDGAGRLIAVTDWLGHTTRFGYDPDGNLTSETYPNGVTENSAFDDADELLSITYRAASATLDTFTYTRSSLGQVTAATAAGVLTQQQAYAYTPTGQLASAGGGQYTYDQDGNLTQQPGGITLSYNAAGQLTSRTQPASAPGQVAPGTTTYGYDGNGNRTSISRPGRPAITLTYNQANQLTAYGTTASYAYNGDGLRMSKTVNHVTTAFTWDQSGSLPVLIAAGEDSYLDGPADQPFEQVSNGTVTYLLADQQGSIRLLTDAAGTVTGTYTYTAYGAVTRHAGPASTALQFDGQYTDAETGYQYLQARYYDPATAQFLTVDPEVTLTSQAYLYAGSNPLNATDPTGLSWWNPFSWNRHTWDVIAKVAEIVAKVAVVVAAAVALCAETACLGDLAFLGIDSAALYETAEAISWGVEFTADVVGTIADTAIAIQTCNSSVFSRNCVKAAGHTLAQAGNTLQSWNSRPGNGED